MIDEAELDLLRGTARAFFAEQADLPALADAGLLGLLTPEDSGGEGWRVQEACAVAVEAGRALGAAPWAESALVAAALAHSIVDAPHVEAILEGKSSGAFLSRRGLPEGRISGCFSLSGWTAPLLVVLTDSYENRTMVVEMSGATIERPVDPVDTTRGDLVVSWVDAQTRTVPADPFLPSAAVLLACADSLGALAATVELVTEYLAGRVAFGRPLASFQALQHRLAEHTVLVAGAEALVDAAATALADRDPGAEHLVAALRDLVAGRFVAALDDCIQLSGGIGFTWEWPAHHAARRVLVNTRGWTVGAPDARRLRAFHDAEPAIGTAGNQFREQVREIIRVHAPFPAREGHRAPESAVEEAGLRVWYSTMYDHGLLGAGWPPEFGGSSDHEPWHEVVVVEELIRARAPRPIDQVLLASHVLLRFGTDEQRRFHLPRIRSAQDIWCQLFSEPDAGSDLAGIKARAKQRDDGQWILSGQKTWTTDGHWAQFGLALIRTAVEESRHAGITAFIVPMDAPGIEVRPKLTMGHAYEFNDVFLDGVVLGPEHVLGEVGQGWAVATSGLEVERLGVGGNVVLLELLLRDLLSVCEAVPGDAGPLIEDGAVRGAIARLKAEFEAARAFVTGHVQRVLAGREREAEAAIAKIAYTETYNRIARFGMEIVTAHGPVPASAEEAAARLRDAWLWSRALTISGGSSEVMRNIIAKRRLRLPSERSVR